MTEHEGERETRVSVAHHKIASARRKLVQADGLIRVRADEDAARVLGEASAIIASAGEWLAGVLPDPERAS